ncbi:hypothetical protein BHE74_00026013 [Ensete ventricosum]|nr:hypothetical protein BHE74_00026013 [Ensete ventricosum]
MNKSLTLHRNAWVMVELTELAGGASKTDDGLVEIRVANPYMRVLPPEPYHFLVEQSVVILEEIVSFLQASGVVLEVPLAGAVQQGEDAREAPARWVPRHHQGEAVRGQRNQVVVAPDLPNEEERFAEELPAACTHLISFVLQREGINFSNHPSWTFSDKFVPSIPPSPLCSKKDTSSAVAPVTAKFTPLAKLWFRDRNGGSSGKREDEGGGTKEIDDQAPVGAAARRVAEEGHAVRSIADIWSGEGIGVSNKKIAGVGERVSEVEYGIESTGGGGEMEARDQKEQDADGRLHGKHLKDLNEALRPPSGTLLLHQIYS